MRTSIRAVSLCLMALVVSAVPVAAQLAKPNAMGLTMGHVHVNTSDVEAQKRFWTTLGGTLVQRDKLTLFQFPGVYVILREQQATGGSVGTTMNHLGFYVKDFGPAVARWKAAGLPWEPVTTNPSVGQGFITGPDGVRIEIYEDKTSATPMQMHHVHLMVTDPPAAQRWYAERFGAEVSFRMGGVDVVRTRFDTVNVPGAEITLSKAAAAQVPMKGRAFDHIGFEVTSIDRFVAKLQADGIKTDGPVRASANASGLRIVYLTDPWGTEIEITEGLASTPIAR